MSHSLDASAIIPILVDEASSAAVTEFLADVAVKPASTGLIVKFGHGGEQMVFVHHHPAEPPLPEMATLMGAGVYPAGVTPAGLGEGLAQPVLDRRGHDEMDGVGSQAVGPDLGSRTPRRRRDQRQIGAIVVILEEHPFPASAALGNVVGKARSHEAGHGPIQW